MRTDGAQWGMHHALMKNKVIADKIDENIQEGISAAAGCITEGLLRHEPSESRIKEVYGRNNAMFKHWRAVELRKGSQFCQLFDN